MNKIESIIKRSSIKFERGSEPEDPVKAVTPMVYWGKFDAKDGYVVNLGIGWWHWYAKIQVGYIY